MGFLSLPAPMYSEIKQAAKIKFDISKKDKKGHNF